MNNNQQLELLVQKKKGRPKKIIQNIEMDPTRTNQNHDEYDDSMTSEFVIHVYFHGCSNKVTSYVTNLYQGSWYYCEKCRKYQKIKEVR